jgi:hypothetical protein
VTTRLFAAAALLALAVAGTSAQDARGVLQAVAKNIGADRVTTLQISGTSGWSSAPGASYSPSDDWPRFELTNYSKQIDFNTHVAPLPARERRARGLYDRGSEHRVARCDRHTRMGPPERAS